MSRRKGSPNRHPSFVSDERIKRKAEKLHKSINEFMDLAGRNRNANPEMDWPKWNEIEQSLLYIIKTDFNKP